MTARQWLSVLLGTILLAGCAQSPPPRAPSIPSEPPAGATRPTTGPSAAATTAAAQLPAKIAAEASPPAEPLAKEFAPPAAPTQAHLAEIEPAVLDLARRAEQADTAYFTARMGQPGEHHVQLMIERVRACDLTQTYRSHLIGDRLNYHDKSHVQVELAKRDGKWEVSRLWFCR